MAILKRTENSRLFEAYRETPQDSRFCWWSTQDIAVPNISLADAWKKGGVFIVAAENETTEDLAAFGTQIWSNDPSTGDRLIAWKKGDERDPAFLRFNNQGEFKFGTTIKDFLMLSLESPGGDENNLTLSLDRDAVFSAVVDQSGISLTLRDTRSKVPFKLKLGSLGMNIVVKEKEIGTAKVFCFCRIVVDDEKPGSGSWEFESEKSCTLDFLATAIPIIKFWQSSISHQKFSVFDIACSKSELDETSLIFNLHPYVASIAHSSIRFKKEEVMLVSNFIDAAGRQVKLATWMDSVLYFQANTPSVLPRFHLAPTGRFSVKFNATASARVKNAAVPVMEVLVGTAGTEFVQFGDGTSSDLPNSLLFVPDSPACLIRNKQSGDLEITDKFKTSWVVPVNSAKPGSEFPFVAQAEEAPLFAIKPRIDSRNAFTGLREVHGMAFDPAPTFVSSSMQKKIAMPMLPIRGVLGDIGTARNFNERVLVPKRRDIAARHRLHSSFSPPAISFEELRWVVMPQGFSVALDSSNRWRKVMFALTDTKGEVSANITLSRPDVSVVDRWPVEESLSRPATFLVATRFPDRMPDAQRGDDPEIPMTATVSVRNWIIEITIGKNELNESAVQEPPIFVVKLGGDKNFNDLLKDTSQWSLASVFNKNPTSTRDNLSKTFTNIEKLVEGKSPLYEGANLSEEAKAAYKLLLNKLLDPDWNGVILFNGSKDPDTLPEDVAVLSAGFNEDKQKFWVPCIGLDLCKVKENSLVTQPQEDPKPPMQVPSIFAAIHFFDPNPIPVGEDEHSYAMKLKNLDVVLHNSSLSLFNANADLRLGTMFGIETGKNNIAQISGSYQGHSDKDNKDKDIYLIRAIGIQTIDMKIGDVIKNITLNRLELTSSYEEGTRRILGRIGIWVNIECGSKVTDLTGLKNVRGDNLAISVTVDPIEKTTKFAFDAGHLDVDWQRPAGGKKLGWLDNFPMMLSGISWSGCDFSGPKDKWPDLPSLELPNLGFSTLNLGNFPGASGLGSLGTKFDFALKLKLDMGSFGAMTDAAKLLNAEIIFGWSDFRRIQVDPQLPKFAIGFKFEGGAGPLDIGIQGVLRLKAKKAIIKSFKQISTDPDQKDLLGFALDEPQLEVFGYKVPTDPANLQLAVVLEQGDSASKNSKKNLPTWVFANKEIDAGPVYLKYFSIGQNVLLLDLDEASSITSVPDAVTMSTKWMKDKFADEQLWQLRPESPNGKWNLVADGSVNNIADVKLVFLDDVPLYGLRVLVPKENPLFDVDILYKKIAEDLGVFSLELDLKGLRTIDLGVGNLTLPVITFRKFTNSNWDIDLGFRHNDFSAAATLQILPYLGSCSMRVGQLNGQAGNFLRAEADNDRRLYYDLLNLDPVYEIQLAFRVGIGREIRQSIFSACATLSVYGLFQGALGTITHPEAKGHRYVKLAGAAGILLEVFGEVNFAVISAAVYIRLWIEAGMTLETWQKISLYAEAGVKVYVRFVVARIRIWKKRIEIAVHYSFETKLRVGAELGGELDTPVLIKPPASLMAATHFPIGTHLLGNCQAPINWVAQEVGEKLDVVLAVQFDAQAGDDKEPILVPMLALIDSYPQGRELIEVDATSMFVTRVLRWAIRLSMEEDNPEWIETKHLRTLLARLRPPGNRSLSRWLPTAANGSAGAPLDHKVIREFFACNFLFKLRDPQAAQVELQRMGAKSTTLASTEQSLPGIVMPWLRELGIFAGMPPKERKVRDFMNESPENIDEEWELYLRKKLAQGRPRLDSLDNCQSSALVVGELNQAIDTNKKALLDILLEDWFACLVEAGAYSAMQIVIANNHKMSYALLEKIFSEPDNAVEGSVPPATTVARQASAVFLHAMRIPESDTTKDAPWIGLLKSAKLELRKSIDIWNDDTVLKVRPINTGSDSAKDCKKKSWIEQGDVILEFGYNDKTITAKEAYEKVQNTVNAVFSKPVSIKVEAILDERPREYTATHGTPLFDQDGDTKAGMMFQLPTEVVSLLAGLITNGKVPDRALNASLKGFGEFKEGDELKTEYHAADTDKKKVRVGGFIKLALRRVNAAPGASDKSETQLMRGIYGVSGGGEAARLVLNSWMKGQQLVDLEPDKFWLVWNPSSGKIPSDSTDSVTRKIKDGARFFATNLSIEANPDRSILDNNNLDVDGVITDLSNPSGVRAFLWRTALVNSDGFYLALDETINNKAIEAIESYLDAGVPAEIAVVWSRPAFTKVSSKIHPLETHLFVDPDVAKDKLTVTLDLGEKLKGSGVPEGYVKLRISKPNPMLDAAFADDDQKDFFARYAFVEYSVVKSMPFVEFSADACTPLPLDAPKNNIKLTFENQEPAEMTHTALIPLLNFAYSNRNNKELKNPDDLNPYALLGQSINDAMGFGLRDAAGHRYPEKICIKFDPTKIVYRDPLIALGTYPGVSLNWNIRRVDGTAKVIIKLLRSQPKSKYTSDEVKATRKQFQLLAWMLDAPEPSAPGISVTACVTVGNLKFTTDVLKDLRKFLKEKILESPDSIGTGDMEIEIDVPIDKIKDELNSGDVKQLRVTVELKRDEKYLDEELAKTDSAMRSITSEVLPAIDHQKESGGWPQFADKFEQAFMLSNNRRLVYFLKLTRAPGSDSCWLISEVALHKCLEAKRGLASFAPLPLSRNFVSGDARLRDFNPKLLSESIKTVSDIDLDLLASHCFEFIEDVLAPAISARMCAIRRESFNSIMESKAKIVATYADKLSPIEKVNEKINPEKQVKARFTAAAAANLRKIYELGAICSISMSSPLHKSTLGTPRVYGMTMIKQPDGKTQSFELSNMRFDLSGTDATALSVFWKGERKDASVIGSLQFEPQYIECQWPSDTGKLIPSRWFELLSPTARKEKTILNDFIVPLPLRVLPTTPNIFGHSFEPPTAPASLQEARRWKYKLDTAAPAEDHDQVTYTINYESPPTFSKSSFNQRTAFDVLVNFQHYAQELTSDLATVLKWKKGDDSTAAENACKRLSDFISDVASYIGVPPGNAPGALMTVPRDEFVTTLKRRHDTANFAVEGGTNQYEIKIECTEIAGKSKGRKVTLQLSDIRKSPPVYVNPSQGATIVDPKPRMNATSIFSGQNTDDVVKGVAGLVGRSLELSSLDIFEHATAIPQIQAKRNAELGGLKISEKFIFTTATTTAEKLVPRLKYKEIPFIRKNKQTLSEHLAYVGRELFDDTNRILSVDALATLRVPFGGNHADTSFGYPLGAMKGVVPSKDESWGDTFREWGARLESELAAKSIGSKPIGIDLSLAVYADYADSKPVLLIERITIPWSNVQLGPLSIGFVPPKVERPVDLAGILFSLTRSVEPPDNKASANAIKEVRTSIARFLKAGIPTLNDVEKIEFPSDAQLRNPATDEAWKQCVEASIAAFNKTADKNLPILWALEPFDCSEGIARSLTLRDVTVSMNSKIYGFLEPKVLSKKVTLRRTQPSDIYEGSVALVAVFKKVIKAR